MKKTPSLCPAALAPADWPATSLASFASCACALLLSLSSASAVTFTVNSNADLPDADLNNPAALASNGLTTLRAAIMQANKTPGNDIINIQAGIGTITLNRGQPDNDAQGTNDEASGDLDITGVIVGGGTQPPNTTNHNDLTINGAVGGSTIQAGTFTAYPTDTGSINTDRIFDIGQDGIFGGGFGGSTGIDVTLTNLILQNGNVREALNTGLGGGNYAFGGAIRFDGFGVGLPHGSLTLINCTINNNQADNAGGGLYHVYGTLNVDGCTFSNNITKAGEGGGLFFGAATSASNVSITNSNFTANEARQGTVFGTFTANADGGGLRINADPNTVTITNTNFTNNIAQEDGGAIKTLGAAVTVTGGTITGNTARRHGGAIFGDQDTAGTGRSFTISGATLRNNRADSDNTGGGDGGAIFRDRGVLNITNCIIGGTGAGEPNTAINGGGVAHFFTVDSAAGNTSNQTTVTINGGSINGNIANSDGGGVYFNSALFDVAAGTLNLGSTSATAMTANFAKNHGGALHVSNAATANLNNMTLRSNQANSDSAGGGDGGALFLNVGTASFTGTLAIGGAGFGNSGVNGGGIRNNAGTVNVPASASITHNTASGTGGGISNAGTTSALSTPTITNNSATGSGGGLHNTGTLGTLTGGLIVANTSGADGGGVAVAGGTATFTNTTISGNNANGNGGGLVAAVGSITLNNVTLGNNRADNDNNATGAGGGIQRASGTVTLNNTLVAANLNENGASDAPDDVSGAITANFSLIETTTGATIGGGNNQVGLSARLGALQNNGGAFQTMAVGGGSPALDNGSNGLVGGLTTDARGAGFARLKDAGDADATDEVDIGSYEAHPGIEDIADQSTNEDTAKAVVFNFGDTDLTIGAITATSGNTTLLPNANIAISGSGASRTLTLTPVANLFGAATVTVTVSGTENAVAFASTDTFVLTVNPIADTPSGTGATTLEDTQTSSGLALSRNAVDGVEVTHFKITGITNGTLFKNNGTSVISNNDFITFAEGSAGLKFTPAANLNTPAGDAFAFTVQAGVDGAGTGLSPSIAVPIMVSEVNDPPVATDDPLTSVLEDSPLRVISIATLLGNDSRGPANEAAQTLTMTGVANAVGGTVAINGANVEFVPALNFNGTASFDYTVQDNGTTAGVANPKTDAGAVSFTITAVNDKPSFAAANPPTVSEDAGAQTVGIWAIFSPGPTGDGGQTVVAYTVSGVSNPALFSAGPSVAPNGTLTYTAAANANGAATFTVRVQDNGGTANGGVDLSDPQTFTITVNAVNDAPSFTKGADQTVNEDALAQTVPAWATALSKGPADEAAQMVTFVVTNNNNALFNALPAVSTAGALTYTPAPNANGVAMVTVRIQDNGGTANGGVDTSAPQTFTITVTAVNDAPSITAQAVPIALAQGHARTIVFTDVTVMDPDNTYPTGFTLTVQNGANYTRVGNTITPTPGFVGTLSVPVLVNDSAANSNIFNLVVTVNPNAGQVATNATIVPDVGSNVRLNFLGAPTATYTIQFTNSLAPANWQTLATRVADANGRYFLVDAPPPGTPMRYYRSTEPYLNDFGNGLGPVTLRGSAVLTNSAMKLTDEVTGGSGAVVFEGLVPGPALNGFTARFNLAIGPISFGVPADGVSFAVGNLGVGAWGEAGPGTPNSLAVGFDTFDNGSAEGNIGIHVWVNGIHLALNATNPYTNGATVPVEIRYDTATGLTVRFNSVLIFTNLPIAGFAFPATDGRFGISARTGGFSERAVVDDVEIMPR